MKQSSGVKVKSELEQTGAQLPRRQAHRLPERTRKYLFFKINCLIEGFSLTLKSMMPMLVLSVKGNQSIGFNLLWNFFSFLELSF